MKEKIKRFTILIKKCIDYFSEVLEEILSDSGAYDYKGKYKSYTFRK
ncbi:MAG: hypothetical protein J6J86_01370 [Lachnospiraceae bacterium]|nr:hypothetical protein [Lachnospiraceae bacterium]